MTVATTGKAPEPSRLPEPSGPIADLVLTLPMFLGYHLGVIFLPIRNAADVVTRELVALANHDMKAYGALTVGIGLAFVVLLGLAGRGHALKWQRFVAIALEGVVYAVAMRLAAAYVVGRVFLGALEHDLGPLAGLVMSFGAGFYEEIAFRVVLFGLGLRVLLFLFPVTVPFKRYVVASAWAVVAAGVFSGWHYVGALGEPFDPRSFVFRWVCGLVFTVIFALRGFAPAVWTHTVYDVWVLVF